MGRIIKSIGYGLTAAGVCLLGVYCWGLYLKGSDVLRDALDPFTLRNYGPLAVLLPGAFLLWLGDLIASPRRPAPK